MARMRVIKPEFWTSEQVVECSPNARLLFLGLMNFADDNGVHPLKAMRIKMEIFPGDGFSASDVKGFILELKDSGLIVTYSVDEEDYLRITGFTKHQRIDQPTYKYPLENGEVKKSERRNAKKSKSSQLSITEDSANKINNSMNDHGKLGEHSGRDSKGRDSKGKDSIKTSCQASPDEPKKISSIPKNNFTTEAKEIFEYWKTKTNKTDQVKFAGDRKTKVLARLRDGYSVSDIKLAIDGIAKSPYHQGQNDQGKIYDDLELVCRSVSKLEGFIKSSEKIAHNGIHASQQGFLDDTSDIFRTSYGKTFDGEVING